MAEATVTTATTPTEAEPIQDTLLNKADQPIVSGNDSVLDTAGAEDKAAREAEEKRILDTKDEELTSEDKTRKAGILKAKQEAADKAAAEIRAKGVPEKYELKPPDGFTLDEPLMAKLSPVFKTAGLTNAQAQAMVDYHAVWQKEQSAISEANFKSWNENNTKETMAALGVNAKSELAYVAKVRSMLSSETIEAINASGIGNIKSFIFDMAKIGRMFSEEKLVSDKRSAASNTKDAAELIYPTMAQK